jgi:hypothetical protein
MRCVIGLVVFLVLYFGSLKLLSEFSTAIALRNDPGMSQRTARAIGNRTMQKYHAILMAGSLVIAIGGCALPTILLKRNERANWEQFGEEAWHR